MPQTETDVGRGRIKPEGSRRVIVRPVGDGPPCPESRHHGHLYVMDGRYWCPHEDHGGNGKFFKEVA